jgi:aminoglycoside phosphotransferase (APT) family kinase protein
MSGTDETIAERADERLDRDALESYLIDQGFPGEVRISQFPAGSSNLTYLIAIDSDEFVLRRPPFGNTVKTAHDMRREFDFLSKLSQVYPPAPKPILFCDHESVIGSEFYLMERRHGLVIRGRVGSPHVSKGSTQSQNLLKTSRAFRAHVCKSFIGNLVDLHSIDYKAAGLTGLGKPEGYCRRQVEGWTKRYFAAKTDEHTELESAIEWLISNIRNEFGASIIHNDYKFDNVMLDPNDLTMIIAVLDWEMVTIGDPLMDLGTTLGYWMSPDAGDEMLNMPFNPRVLMENVSRKDLVEVYAEASGRELPDMLFYYVFGTFKIAVICQQIYARYVKGFTKDERFANFDRFVASLGRIASDALHRASV